MSSFTSKTLLAVLAGAASVAAHGHVTKVTVKGKSFPGFAPSNGLNAPAGTVGWATTASDNGFVLPSAFNSRDIACHKGSVNAKASVPVNAGDSITIQWDTWPGTHKGPVIDYLASCGSTGCDKVDVTSLQFFKIDEAGLENGVWASDKLINQGNKWEVTIPASIKAGSYVLRHEMFGLHEGNRANGAQMYPQCINLEVSGTGTETPAGVVATKLYTAQDPGVLFNLYNNPTSYPIPGPAVFSRGAGNAGNAGGNNGGNGNNNGGNGGNGKNNNGGNGKNNTPTTTRPATQPAQTKPATSAPVRDCKAARRQRREERREAARREAALRD
ncbi:hypothetical protein RB594_009210 [Gaeumannomyces avenae]